MSTEIKLIVNGGEIIVEASSEHLSAVKAAGTSYMRKHEATSGFFTFDGVNWVRHANETAWHATMASDVAADEKTSDASAADINVGRKENAPEKKPAATADSILGTVAAIKECLAVIDDLQTVGKDELPDATEADFSKAVAKRSDHYRVELVSMMEEDVECTRGFYGCENRLCDTLSKSVDLLVHNNMEGMVTVRSSRHRPVAMVSGADGVLVSKSLIKPEAERTPFSSKMSCIATFKKAVMSAVLTLGAAFYSLTAPTPVAACETWDVAPATHQTILAEGYREHFSYTLPSGEYVEAVGDLLPDRAQCDRALDEDLVKLEAELENARAEAGTVILEKVIGSCHYEQIVDGLHVPAWRK